MSRYFALFFSKKNSNCLRKLGIEVGCMCGRVHPIKPQRSPSVFHVLASSHLSMPTAVTARNFLRYHTDITFEAHNQLGSLAMLLFVPHPCTCSFSSSVVYSWSLFHEWQCTDLHGSDKRLNKKKRRSMQKNTYEWRTARAPWQCSLAFSPVYDPVHHSFRNGHRQLGTLCLGT